MAEHWNTATWNLDQFQKDFEAYNTWPRLPGGQLDPKAPRDPRQGPGYMGWIFRNHPGAQRMVDQGLGASSIVQNLEAERRPYGEGGRQTNAELLEQQRQMDERQREEGVIAQLSNPAPLSVPAGGPVLQGKEAFVDVYGQLHPRDPTFSERVEEAENPDPNAEALRLKQSADLTPSVHGGLLSTGNVEADKAIDNWIVGLQQLDETVGADYYGSGLGPAAGTVFDPTTGIKDATRPIPDRGVFGVNRGYYDERTGEFVPTARETKGEEKIRIQRIVDDFNATMQAWTTDEKENFVIAMNQVRVTGQVPSHLIETHQPPHDLAGEFTSTSKLLLDIADKYYKDRQSRIDADLLQADSVELVQLQAREARNLARLQASLDETKAEADDTRAAAGATSNQTRAIALLQKAHDLDVKLLNKGNEFKEKQYILERTHEMQMASWEFHQEKALEGVRQEGAEAIVGMETQAGEDLAELEAQLGETRAEANAVRAEAAATSNQERAIALLEEANKLDVAVRNLENKFTAGESRLARTQERQIKGLEFTQEMFTNPSALAAFQFNQLGQVPQGAQQVGFNPSQRPGAGFVGPSLLQGGGLFPGGAPTMGGLNQLVPEQLEQLQGLLSLFGIAPGLLGQRARQVTPGVQFRPDLIGGGRMQTER